MTVMRNKKIFFIVIIVLFGLYFLNYSYGRHLCKNALHFPDSGNTVVTVKSYADNGSSLELDEEEKNTLFDLIKEETQFQGYSSQNAVSPIVQGEDVFAVMITGNEYSPLLYLSEESEKTVLCVDNHYLKIGEMRQTKSFVKKLFSNWRGETENWEAEYQESGKMMRLWYRGEDRPIHSMDITVQAGLEISQKHEEYDDGEYLRQGKEITLEFNDTKLSFDEIDIRIQCDGETDELILHKDDDSKIISDDSHISVKTIFTEDLKSDVKEIACPLNERRSVITDRDTKVDKDISDEIYTLLFDND